MLLSEIKKSVLQSDQLSVFLPAVRIDGNAVLQYVQTTTGGNQKFQLQCQLLNAGYAWLIFGLLKLPAKVLQSNQRPAYP
ncbi:MAG: hypothetical protein A3C80_03580 [Candidatus Ryanbacteria bacterium RIFCSPHIGHO2_02_FULL_45_43]|uniref:Uncharacterized protein n=1 Tax=Candidatus Ryanbacteria bacterium RIFCSPHIGHO2_01_45_13 TaxID=1802112 RepID=A0A1G2G1S4_9BACT|nr:MAG: hypothetical protein A2718_03845 [Candidatus Ryanbacteria bacterium RIFCSPHIGHO2_01_FULL_44_130]OGZ43798.1 MAG: hypothetical protein A2W41_00215 [Candidatus Ryanbacteria bacterium RIFCSPHIGHO2_01_45_13]OGZ48008.1 MAG: hypothetical protein A3C80_03580 [Candidatus Ryanbacteria bacterium RIFCSPHIGHO2_02_FULL_45_43]OGZ50144.1 MAG: hypothetical protein A3E55_01445 [Candidatus Ryanbacteria bacterium RIFCSPHIGHO2_12_FULL_44_20]OGZ51146.1 MAG: hypothetical protein A3A17_03885 [Candidatus Ryanba